MRQDIYDAHIRAGKAYGRAATCGNKIDYKSEDTSRRAADAMNKKNPDKRLEAYPCAWCRGWHIGREMTEEEAENFL